MKQQAKYVCECGYEEVFKRKFSEKEFPQRKACKKCKGVMERRFSAITTASAIGTTGTGEDQYGGAYGYTKTNLARSINREEHWNK